MKEAGWNRSVLEEYTYSLGEYKYKLPELASYDDFSAFCTCVNSKRSLLEVRDQDSDGELVHCYV